MNTRVGNTLKKMRKLKGWSQEQVADYLTMSQSAYARMESGESNSWANNLDKIIEIFEIDVEDLFKQDNLVINNNQQGGSGYIQIVNQLSEKLIEQYEERIKELKEQNTELKAQLQNLE